MKKLIPAIALLVAAPLYSACSSEPKLFGKYQSNEDLFGIEFLEGNNAVFYGGELDNRSVEYEILKGSDGYSIKFDTKEVFDIEQKGNTLIMSSANSTFEMVKTKEFTIPSLSELAIMSEGRTWAGALNRSQQAYFLENDEFTSSFAALDIGIEESTENFSFKTIVHPSGDGVFNLAIPNDDGIRGSLGIVHLDGEATVVEICEPQDPSTDLEKIVQKIKDVSLDCPDGTKPR